jgi:hypothetical protein
MWYYEKYIYIKKQYKLRSQQNAEREKKKYCTTNSAIIQLHAIVYAVIYYDFRITL